MIIYKMLMAKYQRLFANEYQISTKDYVRIYKLFMQNKANFMRFSPENADFTKKQSQFKPNLTQNKPNLSQNKANSKPICSELVEGFLQFPARQEFMKIFKYFPELYCIILHIVSYYYISMKGVYYAINVNR